MDPDFVIHVIKRKFEATGPPARVPNLKGKIFKAELVDGGIKVDNLGQYPFLKWDVFRKAFQLIRSHKGWAEKGNAMNAKLGENGLSFESIEGHIAQTVYDKKEGDAVFRRITPIASILIWAGICENVPNGLRLTDFACEDERVIRLHWNYFLALEKDVGILSRYVEFERNNFATYSIEMAHLLLSISSEVDVVSKALCSEIDHSAKAGGIKDYRKLIPQKYPEIRDEPVFLPRYNLSFKPWHSWHDDKIPEWWHAYNKVKHQRGEYFSKANLQNVINSISGLFVVIFYLRKAQIDNKKSMSFEQVLEILKPLPSLLRLDRHHYMFLSKEFGGT